MKAIVISVFALAVVGCASTGVMTREAGQFFIAKADAHLSSGPPANIKKEAYAEAAEHCAKENKGVETVKIEETNAGHGGPAAIALTFKCAGRR